MIMANIFHKLEIKLIKIINDYWLNNNKLFSNNKIFKQL